VVAETLRGDDDAEADHGGIVDTSMEVATETERKRSRLALVQPLQHSMFHQLAGMAMLARGHHHGLCILRLCRELLLLLDHHHNT
jgi:hypothetical protein